MWFKAQCIKECIFRGVRRKPGDVYEGPLRPPHHFRILETRDDGGVVVEGKRNVCPFCGNELPAAPVADTPVTPEEPEEEPDEDPGKTLSQLKRMSIPKLVEYGNNQLGYGNNTVGTQLTADMTKDELIERIQSREVYLAQSESGGAQDFEGSAGNDEGVN